uniref:SLPTX15 n=1 Tax=Scolopendra viridis TaxID=118503 RepID=A0A4D5R9L6_SCOVI
MGKQILLALFLLILLVLPAYNFPVHDELIAEERNGLIKKKLPYRTKDKFPRKSQCVQDCAKAFTNGNADKIKDVKPDFFTCYCWYVL